jgi:S1-C subfamily serine protease
MAKYVLPQLMKHGRVIRGYLGLHARAVPIDPTVRRRLNLMQKTGVEVLATEPGGPAEDAGLEPGDVVISLGEQPASSVDELQRLLTELPVGIPSMVAAIRDGRRFERLVVPAEYPDEAHRS